MKTLPPRRRRATLKAALSGSIARCLLRRPLLGVLLPSLGHRRRDEISSSSPRLGTRMQEQFELSGLTDDARHACASSKD
jgi:hypothetical protein